jgi:hypothetical protein
VKEDLNTTEVNRLLKDAYSFGMRAYYAFGGESDRISLKYLISAKPWVILP